MSDVKMADEITDDEISRVLTALTAIQRFFGRPPIWPYFRPMPICAGILDNLGLSFNVAMMDAWPGYVRARDRFFGKGRLAQWLMHRIHPRFLPRRHAQLKRQWVKERTAMQAEFLNAVIEAGGRPKCGELIAEPAGAQEPVTVVGGWLRS